MQDSILGLSTWKTVQSGQNAPGKDDSLSKDVSYQVDFLRGILQARKERLDSTCL
jgi:hypothetical protein